MSAPEAPQRYIFRKCINSGCSAMIGWVIGTLQGEAECKWCAEGRAHWQEQQARKERAA